MEFKLEDLIMIIVLFKYALLLFSQKKHDF